MGFGSIDYNIHKEYFISDMSIQYKNEVRPLEDVLLYLAHQQQRYIVEGKDQEGNVLFLQ